MSKVKRLVHSLFNPCTTDKVLSEFSLDPQVKSTSLMSSNATWFKEIPSTDYSEWHMAKDCVLPSTALSPGELEEVTLKDVSLEETSKFYKNLKFL